MVTPLFCVWTCQQKSTQTGASHFNGPPTSLHPPKTIPGNTWTQLLITNFLTFNPPQYESNQYKQGLLITTCKISHCLLQLQIIESQYFHLTSAISPIIMGWRTTGLTHLLGRQDKQLWLIVQQLLMNVGLWDAPFALRHLDEAIWMYAKIWFLCQA